MKWIKIQKRHTHSHWHNVRPMCRIRRNYLWCVGAMSYIRFKSERLLLIQMDWGYGEHFGCVNHAALYMLCSSCSNNWINPMLVEQNCRNELRSRISFYAFFFSRWHFYLDSQFVATQSEQQNISFLDLDESTSIFTIEFEIFLVDISAIWPPKFSPDDTFSSDSSGQWSNLDGKDIMNASWICIPKK